jgi:hypothetical protein
LPSDVHLLQRTPTTTITPAINGWKKQHCSLAIKARERKVTGRRGKQQKKLGGGTGRENKKEGEQENREGTI